MMQSKRVFSSYKVYAIMTAIASVNAFIMFFHPLSESLTWFYALSLFADIGAIGFFLGRMSSKYEVEKRIGRRA